MKRLSPLVVGNWKMNGLRADLIELASIAEAAKDTPMVGVAICPPFTLIAEAAANTPGLPIGAQDCDTRVSGAHTGNVSAPMIADAGGQLVIVGHSERRAEQGESNTLVRAKAEAGLSAGLLVIVCVGETEAERDAGRAEAVVEEQLAGSLPDDGADRLVVAYEPVWAIGTGRTPTNEDIAAMHAAIRAHLEGRYGAEGGAVPILYGGSVKPSNANEILALPHVNGALVGGASLKVADFGPIIAAAAASA